MPYFKIFLSNWTGNAQVTTPKVIEAESQYLAIKLYMSEIGTSHIGTHIVVSGGLSRNERVFTIREFQESISKKENLFFKQNNNSVNEFNVSDKQCDIIKHVDETKKINLNETGSDNFKLDANKYIICLFSNGLQFSNYIFINGESYLEALDNYLVQFRDKWGSLLYQNNIWIKNAYGDNRWCKINNQFAVEFSNNVRYQRAIKQNNTIQITVYNSKYSGGGEKIFRVVAHDAVDAFNMYVDSHKEEAYPVSLLYQNETKKESCRFDSSDNIIFVRGTNSTKNIDRTLFKQFESKDYTTIEYRFRLNNEINKIKQNSDSIANNKNETFETNLNKNNSPITSDLFEVFECNNQNDNKHGIWTILSWPVWIFLTVQIVREFGWNRLSKIGGSAILYLAGVGFLIGLSCLFGWIDEEKFESKLKSITSFVDKYPILYPPFFFISFYIVSPWIMIGCFIAFVFLSALFSGGPGYGE